MELESRDVQLLSAKESALARVSRSICGESSEDFRRGFALKSEFSLVQQRCSENFRRKFPRSENENARGIFPRKKIFTPPKFNKI